MVSAPDIDHTIKLAVQELVVVVGEVRSEVGWNLVSTAHDNVVLFLTKQIEGVAVTHLGIPFVAPAWAVHNGKLYVSLYPQGLEMAIAQSGKREDSVLANESFQTAMARFTLRPAGGKRWARFRPLY